MIDINADSPELSLVAKGRAFLDRGDISSALECYGQAYDPDTVDESEARAMLIEARSHLSRKHLLEALECFEEALVMGTDVQRRQALDGISTVGAIRSKLTGLTAEIKKGFEARFGRPPLASDGIALVSDEENVALIADEALGRLPAALAKGNRVSRLPQHLLDIDLPFPTRQCVPYTDDEDVRFILEVAASLSAGSGLEANGLS